MCACVFDVHVDVDALDEVRRVRDIEGEVHPCLVVGNRGVQVPSEQSPGAHLPRHVGPGLREGDGRSSVNDPETVLVGDQVAGAVLVPRGVVRVVLPGGLSEYVLDVPPGQVGVGLQHE